MICASSSNGRIRTVNNTYTVVIHVLFSQASSQVKGWVMAREVQETDWTAVIARTLAFLCIRQGKLEKETLLKQAEFLERFGIPRAEGAVILGSSEKSLNDMERQQKSRKKTHARKSPVKKQAARKSRA